jgi:hypothetical protein
MAYPAQTVEGETIQVVEKRVGDGTNSINTTVLVADDGRLFAPTPNGLRVVEIAVEDDGADADVSEVETAVPVEEPLDPAA